MGVQFNGTVTINGSVEIYNNGSMKIATNQLEVNINALSEFIAENLKYSPNKNEYLEAVKILKNPNKTDIIKKAVTKLSEMGKELGKNIVLTGLSQAIIDMIKMAMV